jgi:predicted transcriptional regulator
MKSVKFPPGWDEARVRHVLEYYENQSEEEAAAEAEAMLRQGERRHSTMVGTTRQEVSTMASAQTSVKEQMVQIIEAQPEDSSFDEILRELAFARMIERGLEDVDQGRTVSHEEVRREVESWGT